MGVPAKYADAPGWTRLEVCVWGGGWGGGRSTMACPGVTPRECTCTWREHGEDCWARQRGGGGLRFVPGRPSRSGNQISSGGQGKAHPQLSTRTCSTLHKGLLCVSALTHPTAATVLRPLSMTCGHEARMSMSPHAAAPSIDVRGVPRDPRGKPKFKCDPRVQFEIFLGFGHPHPTAAPRITRKKINVRPMTLTGQDRTAILNAAPRFFFRQRAAGNN